MVGPRTRRIFLRPITEEDLPILWRWRNSQSFRDFCSCRKEEISLNEFETEIQEDFTADRHEQYMICQAKTDEPMGTIFSYGFDPVNGHVSITTYLSDGNHGLSYGPEAFLLFIAHLFEAYNLFKIYTEVYDYNDLSLRTMLKGGFIEEGRFKGHRLYKEGRCDLLCIVILYLRFET